MFKTSFKSDNAPVQDVGQTSLIDEPKNQSNKKFGTFGGVFTPSILTILGAIMYLRQGWVVGNAGLGGAIAIILIANVITISTGLSISSVATNIRVRAGGAFSIISQSLGLEVGGSVSVPFYIAQAISVAFYIFAFSEGWLSIFPDHPPIIVILTSFLVAFVIAYISANLAIRAQYFILAIIAASLVSVFLGSFSAFGGSGFTQEPQLFGSFRDGNFLIIFAIYFPAVTGILAGVNMSGDLKDPRTSIPAGTMSAILVSAVVYIALAYWFSRIATPEELMSGKLVIVERSACGPIVQAGILAATFSSALTSLLGAPRLLQAIALHNVLPRSERFARLSASGEPRQAMLITGAIALIAIIFGLASGGGSGGLDVIAPLMTMFFLITYTVLIAVVLIEQTLGLISFRPLFRVPILVPLIGLIGCIFAMFLINPSFSLVAIVVIIGLYSYLVKRRLNSPWSDVRSGLFISLAEWTAKRTSGLPTNQERAWKPDLLFPVRSTDEFLGQYRFLQSLAFPHGSIRILAIYPTGQLSNIAGMSNAVRTLTNAGVFSRVAPVETDDFQNGLKIGLDILRSVFFRPNGLFMAIDSHSDEKEIAQIIQDARKSGVGTLLLAQHPVVLFGREKTINVWIRNPNPEWEKTVSLSNIDLAVLLAYQIRRNWQGTINLISIVAEQDQKAEAEQGLLEIVSLTRLPSGTRITVGVDNMADYLKKAPQADLNIMGVPEPFRLDWIRQVVDSTHTSCLFVRDSGLESALA